MKELKMDPYLEQQKGMPKLPSRSLWIGATIGGYALGMTISSSIVTSLMRPSGPVLGGILNVMVYGAVIGISLGIFQFVVMPRGLFSFHRWILALLIGAAIGFTLAAVIAEILGNAFDITRNIILGEGILAAIAGVIIGLANGLALWLLLRRHLWRARDWILASVISASVGMVFASALVGVFDLPVISEKPSFSFGAIYGIIVGVSQALILQSNWR